MASPRIGRPVGRYGLLLAAVLSALAAASRAADHSWRPQIHDAPPDVAATAKRLSHPPGTVVELVASEPQLANPVAFCFDEQGRIYVAETFRLGEGATDNRAHLYWLKDELAAVTVRDRVRMFERYLPPDVLHRFRTAEDRVRLLLDRDGDGSYETARVFAGGFHRLEDGIGAGLLARRGQVFYACIPHLWLLRDRDGDGTADTRRRLFSGFGVHVAFIGHDLHGLSLGPDGRLYFSIGDRGFNVTTPDGRRLYYPHTGAVLRCELDGSNLEVVHVGLRNPQELAFNRFGDLFTGDNNSDGGDRARIVRIVWGGDSGWTIGFQYAPEPVPRGMWNYEKLWYPADENTGRHIVPPIANLGNGPSGLAYNPGLTALPEGYEDHFFLCDFRGQIPISGIYSFRLVPEGAAYRLDDVQRFVWNVCATDCTFGWDGAFYILDWVEGWEKPGRGRIYRVAVPGRLQDPALRRTAQLVSEGFDARPVSELVELLAYPDQRIRIEASIALAARQADGRRALHHVAADANRPLMARLHAIWGLGMLARRGDRAAARHLAELVNDQQAEIRAQAAKMLGESGQRDLAAALSNLVLDVSLRVRFFATIAAAQLRYPDIRDRVLRLASEHADRDPYLRHAAVLYLAKTCCARELAAFRTHRERPVRLAALLALRRQRSSATARYLEDPDPSIVTEAVRAIYDVPIRPAFQYLLALEISNLPEPAQLRLLLAHRRAARAQNAETLAQVAVDPQFSTLVRQFALRLLGSWATEQWQDPVLGLYRPIAAGEVTDARRALLARLNQLLGQDAEGVQVAAIHALVACEARQACGLLRALVRQEDRPPAVRAEALRALGKLNASDAQPEAIAAMYADSPLVRAAAIEALATIAPDMAVEAIDRLIHSERSSVEEKQAALRALAKIRSHEADRIVRRCMNRILRGEVPIELQLELLEVAEERAKADPSIRQLLQRYRQRVEQLPPIERYAFALRGGSAERGREVFFGNAAVACLRCHKVHAIGGDVGPDLTDIGAKRDRLSILRAIVDPDAEIAEGYESVVLLLDDGRIVTGVLRREDADEIELATAEGSIIKVEKRRIEARRRGPSAMPSDLVDRLSPRELRDLIEFLATLGR